MPPPMYSEDFQVRAYNRIYLRIDKIGKYVYNNEARARFFYTQMFTTTIIIIAFDCNLPNIYWFCRFVMPSAAYARLSSHVVKDT